MSKNAYHYGWHTILDLLEQTPENVLNIYVQKGREDKRLQSVLTMLEPLGIRVQAAHKDRLTAMARSEHHQGIVAEVREDSAKTLEDLVVFVQSLTKPVLLLILDQVTDPHNVGACMRTAVNMGVDAIICPRHHSATLTPTVRKVAAGAANHLPFFQVANLARCLEWLNSQNIQIVGTVLDATARPIFDCDFTESTAIVLGNEETGIRTLTSSLCDVRAYIPMSGPLQSLNVSVACGMVLYEAMRQRGMSS